MIQKKTSLVWLKTNQKPVQNWTKPINFDSILRLATLVLV